MPMGLGIKQLVPTAVGPRLWVLGTNGAFQARIFVLDPTTLATDLTISPPGGFDQFGAVLVAAGFVWVTTCNGGTNSAVLQYAFDGSLLSNTATNVTNLGTAGGFSYDGANTIYIRGAGGIDKIDTGTKVLSVFSAYGTQPFYHTVYDRVNGQMIVASPGGGSASVVGTITVPGGVETDHAVGSTFAADFPEQSPNGYIWLIGADSTSASTARHRVIKFDPVGFGSTILTPPAPVPPATTLAFNSSNGNVRYNAHTGLLYVAYGFDNEPPAFGRVDSIDPGTNAQVILNASLPTSRGVSWVETKDTNIWYTNNSGICTLLDPTGLIVTSATVTTGLLGQSAYTG